MAVTVLHGVTRAKIGALELDASVSESHVGTNDVTSHPIEKGAAAADHIRPNPDELTVEGVISNTPVPRIERERPGMEARAQTAYLELLALKESGQLLTVVTKKRTYEDMAFVSLNVPQSVRTGDAVHFTAVFRKVRVVKSKTVVVVQASTDRAKPKAKKGKQATKPATAAQVNKSILKKAADTGTGDAILKALGAR